MARIKGWKKWKHSKQDNIIWDNKTNKSSIQVAFILIKNKWLLTIWKKGTEDSRIDRYYDTQKQAKQKAIAYMKSHPRG